MWIHGGSWQHGSRRRRPVDLDKHWFIERLLLAGVAVAQIDYRLAAEVEFPGLANDVRTALGFLHAHATDFGIDAERIIVWGESAGAHLALATGLSAARSAEFGGLPDEPRQPVPKPLAIIDWYGPTDLHSLMAMMPQATAEDRERAAEWKYMMDSFGWGIDLASPVRALEADCPPVCIVHGSADRIVPMQQSKLLSERLSELGVEHELHILDGGHVFSDSDSIPTAIDLSLRFLRRHAGLQQPENALDTRAQRSGATASTQPGAETSEAAALPSIAQLRGTFSREMAMTWRNGGGDVIKHGLEIALPGRTSKARLQEPRMVPVGREETLPLVVHLHSGGFVAGGLDTHDGSAARLAAHTGAPVLQVDYRRAPEAQFPAAYDDAVAAVHWAWQHRDELRLREGRRIDRIVLYGESAGGALALSAALALRGEAVPLAAVVAAYPLIHWPGAAFPQIECYLGDAPQREHDGHDGAEAQDPRETDPRLVPGLAPQVEGLPPVFLTVGAHDPLLDDVLSWTYRLRAAQVEASLYVAPGAGHGFIPRAPLGPAEDAAAREVMARIAPLLWHPVR